MITLKSKPFFYAWFSDKINYKKYPFEEFVYTKVSGHKLGFVKKKRFTKVIDLTREEEEIYKSFNKDTRYKINRANKEGCQFGIEESLDDFIQFYNDFASDKGVDMIGKAINKLIPHMVITKVSVNGEILAMHSYVVDWEAKRVRMDKSASHFRKLKEKSDRALIGRANKFLHYESMLYFKSKGVATYDLGGYAYNTPDPVLQSINRFKDSFKGQLVQENVYTPLPFFIAKKIFGKD